MKLFKVWTWKCQIVMKADTRVEAESSSVTSRNVQGCRVPATARPPALTLRRCPESVGTGSLASILTVVQRTEACQTQYLYDY